MNPTEKSDRLSLRDWIGLGAIVGGGGGAGDALTYAGGSGGGGGEYAEITIINPSATYTYTVGAGGTAGSTGGSAGAAGRIVVDEYYNY